MQVPLSAIAASRQALTTGEAAGLAAAALERLSMSPSHEGLPSLDDIRLDGRGRLSFSATGPTSTERERVTQIGLLLQRLLRLEIPGAASPNVPGALLVLVARATGALDVRRPSLTELRDGLRRFGPPAPAMLAAIHRRHAAASHDARVAPAGTPRRSSGALAASLLLSTLALAWPLMPGSPERRTDSRVQIAHERVVASPAAPIDPAAAPAPRDTFRAAVVASPVLSAGTFGADLFSPSFARDGRQLLFHAGRAGSPLLRASFNGGDLPSIATVLQDGAANYHVTQSPDGRWLAFDSDRDGTRGVYVAPSDLTDALAARRVSGPGYAAIPKWSPDGRRLAFVKAEPRRPRVWNVWVADLVSRAQRRVSDHRIGQAWGASWFASGDRLAYSVEDRLVIVDLERGTRRVIPSPRPGQLIRTPAVSPDGLSIVFQVHRDGVWLLDLSTERVRRILDDSTAEEFTWAPDGSRVIYHTKRPGGWSLWQFAMKTGA